jgi:autotransporter translocation and assembly factor TamB
MATTRFRWWHGVLLAALLLVLIGAAASWAIVRVYGPRFTRDRVEAALGEALGQPVRVGAVELRPWLLRVSLADLATKAAPAAATRVDLLVRSLDVILRIDSLWRRELVVSIALTDVDLDAAPRLEGSGEFRPFPLPEFVAVGPLRVRIGTIRLTRAHVAVKIVDPAMAIELRGADVSASPDAGDLDVSLRAELLALDARGRREEVTQIAGDARLSADTLGVRRLSARWQGGTVSLAGDLTHPWDHARALALRVTGQFPLASLAQRAGLGLDVSGTASVSADLAGPPASPRVAGRVSIPELGVAGAEARELVLQGDWDGRRLSVDEIRARLGTGRVSGHLSVAITDGGRTQAALELPEVVLPAPLTDLGRGAVSVQAMLDGPAVVLTRAEATWQAATASVEGRVDTRGPLALRARLSADLPGIARAVGIASLAGRATMTAELSGRLDAPALAGRAGATGLAWDGHAVEPIDAAFAFAGVARGQASPLARWEGTIQSSGVRSGPVALDDVAASLTVDARGVELTRGRLRAVAIPLDATGSWQWSGAGRVHAALGPVALADVAGTSSALKLGGTARGQLDVSRDRGATTAALAVQLERVTAAGLSLGAGAMDVKVHGNALQADLGFPARKLTIDAAGRLEAGAAITARLALDDLALRPLLQELGTGGADQVDGRVSSRGEASIPLASPASGRGSLRVSTDGLRLLGEPWASHGPIAIRWENSRAWIEQCRLDGPAGALSASGVLTGPDGSRVSLALDNARLPGALAELGRGRATVDVAVAGGAIDVTRLDAQWPGVRVAGGARLRGDEVLGIEARVDAELARLRPIIGISAIDGRATLSAEARGRWDAIEGTGQLRSASVQVLGASVTAIDVPFRFSRTALRIPEAQATIGATRITVTGSAVRPGSGPLTADALARDVRFTAALRAPGARWEDLSPLMPAAARGRGNLTFTAQAQGSPWQWRGNGTLTSSSLDLAAAPLRQLRISFALDQSQIEISELRVEASGAPVRATGSWAWAGGGRVNATLGPTSLASLRQMPGGMEGTVRATIEAAMRSPADISGTAHVALEQAAVAGVALGPGRLDVSLRDRAFRADLGFPERPWAATGRGRLDPDGVLTADVEVPDLALGPWLQSLSPDVGPIDAGLSAKATVRIPLVEPRRGSGTLSIPSVRFAALGDSWANRGPIEVRWSEGDLRLSQLDLAGRDGFIRGSGGIRGDGALDARADARLPLALLAALRPEIRDAGGRLELSLRASGTATAPVLAGEGAIHEGSLLLRDRPETLRDFEARLTLSSQGVQLRDVTGVLGGGKIRARGDLALRDWRVGSYRLRLTARDVAVAPIAGMTSAWDADLELSGISAQALLSGDVRLVRGLYSRDLTLLSLALAPIRPAVAANEAGALLRLHLRVALDNNLVVRNRTADLRAGGTVDVEGTTARPIVFGAVESRDGHITFRGHDFTVTTATVRFADPRRIDPFLDVTATARIRDYDVTVQLTGPVSDLAVRLSSAPRLSQDDLLALLTLGATRAELQGAPGSVLATEAGKILVRDLLGLDPNVTGLRVTAGSSTDSNSTTPGAPWDERSRVAPTKSNAGDRREKVRVEYQLLGPLYLSAEYDLEGGYGADLVLRFRFR